MASKTAIKHKPKNPIRPKAQPNWRKKVDWAAAGRKAYETRMKNQRGKGKVVKTQKKQAKPQKPVKKAPQVKQHGKAHGKKTTGFGDYQVNRDALVKALQASKQKEFAPTEVVSLTWAVIKSAKAAANNEQPKRK
jgi:hypothetical protein